MITNVLYSHWSNQGHYGIYDKVYDNIQSACGNIFDIVGINIPSANTGIEIPVTCSFKFPCINIRDSYGLKVGHVSHTYSNEHQSVRSQALIPNLCPNIGRRKKIISPFCTDFPCLKCMLISIKTPPNRKHLPRIHPNEIEKIIQSTYVEQGVENVFPRTANLNESFLHIDFIPTKR